MLRSRQKTVLVLVLFAHSSCTAAAVSYGGPGVAAIVLMGESFRRNNGGTGTGDREIGQAGYEPQKVRLVTGLGFAAWPPAADVHHSTPR
jgi:hypothetical protein